jgi:hypothetical protein
MSKNIRLHKEYGLNPTLPVCIICGEETGEIAMLGAGYKGEAPKHMVLDVKPCEKCYQKYLKRGTLLVEAEQEADGTKQPTGKVTVIRDEAFKQVFNQEIPEHKIIFVEVGILKMLEEQSKHAEEKQS